MSASKNLIQAAAGVGGGDFYPYTVDNSILLEPLSSGSPRLDRTISSGSQTTFTWSFWVKPPVVVPSGTVNTGQLGVNGGAVDTALRMTNSANGTYPNLLWPYAYNGGYIGQDRTVSVFRDASAWYHVVWVVDTTNGTEADRSIIYVNGVRQSVTQDYAWTLNGNTGAGTSGNNMYITSYGYMAEVVFLDGTAASPTDFGEEKNGVWIPKDPSGLTFGTNGFWLDFADSADLGNDVSGNGNDFTSSGLTSSDQMTDTPTNNFVTLNPIFNHLSRSKKLTLAEGNLKTSGNTSESTGYLSRWATKYFDTSDDTGYYFEVYIRSRSYYASANNTWGFENVDASGINLIGNSGTGVGLLDVDTTKSQIRENSSVTFDNLTPIATGNVVLGFAIKGNKVWMHIGGTWINSGNPAAGTGQVATLSGGLYRFGITGYGGSASNSYTSTSDINFGQNGSFNGQVTAGGNADENGYGDFYYSVPSNFYSVCTANFPEPTIGPNSDTTSDEHFNTALWTGNSSTQSITGVGFQPDLIWVKGRDYASNHWLTDVLRGTGSIISTSSSTTYSGLTNAVTSFDSDGFSLGNDGAHNISGYNYVGWTWKGNGSGVSNTDGSITTNLSANTDAGISIMTYTGNATAGATLGHGLGVAPKMALFKRTSTTGDWYVYHESLGVSSKLKLNATDASSSSTDWNSTAPGSSVFTIGSGGGVNTSGASYVAYMFSEVEGFSKFGAFSATSGSDFVYTGFKPALIIMKRTNASGWFMFDNKRGYNGGIYGLSPNTSATETGPWATQINFFANGFEDNNYVADNGTTVIYIAFAENPFKYANAR